MKALCVIPARIGSTRLPNKPLQLLDDKPIIQWTFEGAKQSSLVDKIVVATDSDRVAQVVSDFGGEAVLTDPDIKTGSDRVAYVASQFPDMDVVVNLQGDEPFIEGHMLDRLLEPYQTGENPDMATVGHPLDFDKDYHSPGAVKVIYDQNHYAIYFSRSPLPYFRHPAVDVPVLHHMGVYAFTAQFLQTYTKLEQTKLEQAESLEQLRALEHGYQIKVCALDHGTYEINTPEELAYAQRLAQKIKQSRM